MTLNGWLFDLYPSPAGMVIWLLDADGQHHQLFTPYRPTWYVAGTPGVVRHIAEGLKRQVGVEVCFTERVEWASGQPRPVAAITMPSPHIPSKLLLALHQSFPEAEFFTCDIPLPQQYLYETGNFPLAYGHYEVDDEGRVLSIHVDDSPFELDYPLPPLRTLILRPASAPERSGRYGEAQPASMRVNPRHVNILELEIETSDGRVLSPEAEDPREFLDTLTRYVDREDPDVLLTDFGDDVILPRLMEMAVRLNHPFQLHRTGPSDLIKKRARSYFSYGKIVYKASYHLLRGRWHLDRRNSFMSDECGFDGVLEFARLTGIPVQQAARASIGTGISSMELRTAIQDQVLIPWRKNNVEEPKSAYDLLVSDKGGLVFQPEVGFHENVGEMDFCSMYPSIMATHNLSGETIRCVCCAAGLVRTDSSHTTLGSAHHPQVVPEIGYHVCRKREGVVPKTLRPLIAKRQQYKIKKKTDPDPRKRAIYKSRYDCHKWMLVCCFGYLGYKNARFGRIEAHEATTAYGRKALLTAKAVAEDQGYHFLHAIVDSLWLKKAGATEQDYERLTEAMTKATGLPVGFEGMYRWIGFLPSTKSPTMGVANRYAGVFANGELKIRGVEARRHDTAPFVSKLQRAMLDRLALARTVREYQEAIPEIFDQLREALTVLQEGQVPLHEVAMRRSLSKNPEDYVAASPTAISSQTLRSRGIQLQPGESILYVMTDAKAKIPGDRVSPLADFPFDRTYDAAYYRTQAIKAMATLTGPHGWDVRMIEEALNLYA